MVRKEQTTQTICVKEVTWRETCFMEYKCNVSVGLDVCKEVSRMELIEGKEQK